MDGSHTASCTYIWAFNAQLIPVLTFHRFKSQKKYWFQAEILREGRNVSGFNYTNFIMTNQDLFGSPQMLLYVTIKNQYIVWFDNLQPKSTAMATKMHCLFWPHAWPSILPKCKVTNFGSAILLLNWCLTDKIFPQYRLRFKQIYLLKRSKMRGSENFKSVN